MDKNKIKIASFAVLLAIVIFLYWIFAKAGQQHYALINSFDKCAKAGYPVTQSYPRQCRLPDGEMFVERVAVAEQCTGDSQCPAGKFCGNGTCQAAVFDSSCRQNSDCKLINQDLNYGCCYTGACGPKDYSQSNWIAVNKQQFETARTQACLSQPACGTKPECAPEIVNDNYEARCVGGICEKLPVRPK